MSLPFLIHSLFLILAVGLTFFWVNHPTLSLYTLQLIALFILLYFLNHWLRGRSQTKFLRGVQRRTPTRWDEIIIFTMVVLLLVVSTGGLNSPLFFLIYFLLFGLSLTLEPPITITLTAGLIIFFFLNNPTDILDSLIPLLSLILITPLSLFFGKQYLKVLAQKGEIKILKTESRKQKADIAAEETNTLLWLGLNFKYGMTQIIDLISRALERPGLYLNQKEELKKALRTAKKLLQTGKILEEKIDKQTD